MSNIYLLVLDETGDLTLTTETAEKRALENRRIFRCVKEREIERERDGGERRRKEKDESEKVNGRFGFTFLVDSSRRFLARDVLCFLVTCATECAIATEKETRAQQYSTTHGLSSCAYGEFFFFLFPQ